MDKDKLIEWMFEHYYNDRDGNPCVNNSDLRYEINNGTFNKEPCDMCGYWENIINNGHNDDIKYCTQCGRKLEVQQCSSD